MKKLKINLRWGQILAAWLWVPGALGATIAWTNLNGGNWNAAANWSPNAVPGGGDVAVITNPGNYTVTVDVNPTVGGLQLGGGDNSSAQLLSLNGKTFTLNGAGMVNANGRMNFIGGGLVGLGVLTVNGRFDWSAGNMSINQTGALVIGAGGILTLAGDTLTLNASVITNDGTVRCVSNLSFIANSLIQNNGLWEAQSDTYFLYGGGGPGIVFNNAGTFRKSGGTGPLTVARGIGGSVVFNNSGTTEIQAGTLNILGGGTNSSGGIFNTAAGAAVTFASSYTFNSGSQFTGAGAVRLTTGVATFNGDITFNRLTQAGSALAGTHVLNGEYFWESGSWSGPGATTIAAQSSLILTNATATYDLGGSGNRNLTNNGLVLWTSGEINGGFEQIIQNNGTWEARSDNNFLYGGNGSATFNNAGIFRKSAGTGVTSLGRQFSGSILFNNSGLTDIRMGTLNIEGNGTNVSTGVFNTAEGATLQFSFPYTFNSGSHFTGLGPVRLTAGVATFNGDITFTRMIQTGTASLAGTHVFNGVFFWDSGIWSAPGATTISANSTLNITNAGYTYDLGATGNRSLTNNGTIVWSGGTINAGSGQVIQNNGLFDAQSNDTILYYGSGSVSFNNAGTFRKSAGTGVTLLARQTSGGIIFNNSGVTKVRTGTLNLGGGGTNSSPGYFSTSAGTSLIFSFGYVFNSGSLLTGPGEVSLTSGTATFNGDIYFEKLTQAGSSLAGTHVLNGAFYWASGAWNTAGATTISDRSALYITNNALTYEMGNTGLRAITNNGTVTWTGGSLSVGTTQRIENNGLWDCQGDNSFVYAGSGTVSFVNAGTFRKSAGAGTATFPTSVGFNNNLGTLEVESGTVSLSVQRILGGGAIKTIISGPTQFGRVFMPGATALTLGGTFAAELRNNYQPSVGTAFPVISYTQLSGVFANFELPWSNQWLTNYGATAFTLTALDLRPPIDPITLSVTPRTDGLFGFQVSGTLGLEYIVQTSDKLTRWTDAATNRPATTPFHFVDTNSIVFPHTVYRVRVRP